MFVFFFSSRRRHTRWNCDWSSDVCSSDLGALAGRARKIPQLLWPEWAIRLTPPEGFRPEPFRSTIAACLLVPGNPARSIRQVITGLHAYRSSFAIGAVLRELAGQGHGPVLAAASYLAGYLDACGSPVDYQRRREAIAPDMITPGQWRELCYQASAHPGGGRRLHHAAATSTSCSPA